MRNVSIVKLRQKIKKKNKIQHQVIHWSNLKINSISTFSFNLLFMLNNNNTLVRGELTGTWIKLYKTCANINKIEKKLASVLWT